MDQVRACVRSLTTELVTSAYQQHAESRQFAEFNIPGGMFGNFYLSAAGYRKLGIDPNAIFPDEGSAMGTKSSFVDGMGAHARDDFNDPPQGEWEPGYRKRADAMLLLADDDENYLLRQTRRIISDLGRDNTILVVERGKALRNEEGEGIEHFGYVDGRSQPLYLTTDFQFGATGNRVGEAGGGAIDKWDPFEPLRRVLIRDPGTDADACFGSFLVFRKLEQDVLRFKMREQELADKLELEGKQRELAGALAVGRFEDGTPVTLSNADGFVPSQENNFVFGSAHDTNGEKCPFHAHIRKCNPRGDIPAQFGIPDEEERKHRITRRGIPYGDRNKHPNTFQALSELPMKDVGLLFMCFQASIRQQFAFMQKAWCNSAGFLRSNTGLDPVVGQPGTAPAVEQTWSKEWGRPGTTEQFRFENFVHFKGGEFFFAPSIPFLASL